MKGVPIGIQDFKKLRELDLYFVDKSPLIDQILAKPGVEAHLFTRPRRFGKSLNLSMLDAYLNMRYAGNGWFDGLMISELRPDDPVKNSCPVIYMDLKEFSARSYDAFISSIRLQVSGLFDSFRELADSEALSPRERKLYGVLLNKESDEVTLSGSLCLLSGMLDAHYGSKVVILLDEYDASINDAYGTPAQRDILNFMRDFLSSTLKGNGSLRFAVITGVMQIAKESIFSGLNNVRVNNILSTDMDEMFGFTSGEVERMCSDFGHPEKFEEARQWYDGYRFGDADIYNPWSVLSYVDYGFVPDSYWAGTSGNTIIDDLLSVMDGKTYGNLIALGSNGSIRSDLNSRVTFADISDRSAGIYSVMTMTGYLTARKVDGEVFLSIPNREMYGVFAEMVISKTGVDGLNGKMRNFAKAVLAGDTEGMSALLEDMLMSVLSGRVLDREHSYQAFMLGLLMNLFGSYSITGDFESVKGYHDIRLNRQRGNGPNIVMELKRMGSEESSGKTAKEMAVLALGQIHERKYYHGMTGRTILYGIAFDSKTPTIVSEEIALRCV